MDGFKLMLVKASFCSGYMPRTRPSPDGWAGKNPPTAWISSALNLSITFYLQLGKNLGNIEF